MSTVFFNLRIDEELNDELIKIAENEGRSKNKQIEQILKEYVRKYKNENASININQHHNEKAIVNIDKK
jgi:ribbon-helix-helix protein, copG family